MEQRIYGFLKSGLDAHTLGISHISQLLQECGFKTFISDSEISSAVDKLSHPHHFEIIKKWILQNHITHLGFSYRLDPQQGLNAFGTLVTRIENDSRLSLHKNGIIKHIYFAGLPEACELVRKEFQKRFPTFQGDETPIETLEMLDVPKALIPKSIQESSVYDQMRLEFGENLVEQEQHQRISKMPEYDYRDFTTEKDHLAKRLNAAKAHHRLPLTRVHVGPYLEDREKALALFSEWLKKLSQSRFLDIVSVGSSQLSQSHFGESWEGMSNGGGVPFNSELELRAIREDSSPMLVRAYSGTKNVAHMASILEKNLNMAWHALSLWWFNKIDGRGPLTVKQGLAEHLEAIKYVASVNKPYEPNLPHHFAFRGADDISYVVSAYLAAKTAKESGIRMLVLQNMLNTPKSTWGIRDLVKARVLLKLVRSLEDRNFKVVYQPRAGLDYFSPDENKAKNQLAAVTALMADVEPEKPESPPIIHVVSFSEALYLATPEVVNESIRITRAALRDYPDYRRQNSVTDIISSPDIKTETEELYQESKTMIVHMQRNIKNLFSSKGLLDVFQSGYFPVPFLWECRDEFSKAINWNTKLIDGGVHVVDEKGNKMSMKKRLAQIENLMT
ncbi:MAG: cobalamin-binding protein [Candidatus Aminicenantes bacterium]|nr:cobalamin-binding protein [Candidatus Aminicenantes bacterium]